MNQENSTPHGDSKVAGISEVARFVSVYGSLSFLSVVCVYLVLRGFGDGFLNGVRSLASILFPIIIGSFLFYFRKTILQGIGKLHTISAFTIGFVIGIVVMLALEYFYPKSGIPIAELVVSGSFSILIFSSASTSEDQTLAHYYGVISGFLIYIIVLGFPSLS